MGDSFFRYLKIHLVHNWESLKILSPHCAPVTRRKGSKVRPDMSINVILNICHSEYLHTQRLKKLVAFGNNICEYILNKTQKNCVQDRSQMLLKLIVNPQNVQNTQFSKCSKYFLSFLNYQNAQNSNHFLSLNM